MDKAHVTVEGHCFDRLEDLTEHLRLTVASASGKVSERKQNRCDCVQARKMRPVFAVSSLVLLLLLLLQESSGFLSQTPAFKVLPTVPLSKTRTVVYARWGTKQKEKTTSTTTLVKDLPLVNGEPAEHQAQHVPSDVNVTSTLNTTAGKERKATAGDVVELMEEFNRYIEDGSREMFGNLTEVMEEKMVVLPEDAAKNMSSYLYNMSVEIQKTQMREVERQLKQIEKELLRPFEELAFNDAELFKETKKMTELSPEEAGQRKLEIDKATTQKESMRETSRRMRTREIIRNINVAPYYYTVALLFRWFRKLWEPPNFFINWMRGMASIIKLPEPRKRGETYAEYLKDAELMQAGWKRTGEIAAKGAMARRWAILRRSAEIWAYFSAFYIKERRMYNKYQSGRWSAEKFSEGRSKLGAEVTQNLLKLGPTFIKVSFALPLVVVVLYVAVTNRFVPFPLLRL